VEVGPGGTRRFVHGLGLIGCERADGSWESHIFDGQGSTLALAAADGGLAARHSYDAFGARIGGDALSQAFGFAGRYGAMTDGPALGYMRARSYAPELLRFTSQDPLLGRIVQPQSLNRYVYAGNSPLLRIDPLGEDWSLAWKIPLAVGGGILGIIGIVYLPGILSGIGAGLSGAAGITGVANPSALRIFVSNAGRAFTRWGRNLRGRGPWRSGRAGRGPRYRPPEEDGDVSLDDFSAESSGESSGSSGGRSGARSGANEYSTGAYRRNVPRGTTGSQLGGKSGNGARSLQDEMLYERGGTREQLTSRGSGGDDW
jgi:RHS repeat-associated protein